MPLAKTWRELRRTPFWRTSENPQKAKFTPRETASLRPDRARCSGRGVPIASGIMFLMYSFGRLVALVYIRYALRHRDGAKRRAGTKQTRKLRPLIGPVSRARRRLVNRADVTFSAVLAPPTRTWSHDRRLCATLQGRRAKAALRELGGRARPIVRPGAKPMWRADPTPASDIKHYFTALLRSAHLSSPPTRTTFSRTCCMSSSKRLTYAWTPYALASLRALAAEVERVLLRLLARLCRPDPLSPYPGGGACYRELRRIPIPRTPVNRVGRLGMAAKEENWSIEEVDRRVEANSLLSGRFFFVILCNQEGSLIG
jgi:hypothetical protein